MKKALSLVLAVVLVLGMGVTAFADIISNEPAGTVTVTSAALTNGGGTVTITFDYPVGTTDATDSGTYTIAGLNPALTSGETVTMTSIADGSGTGTLTFTAAANTTFAAVDAGSVNVTVTDAGGSTLTIAVPAVNVPMATVALTPGANPASATYTVGDAAAALSFSATSNDPGDTVTYQWYDGATMIPGATAANYTPSTAAVGTKSYTCVATSTTDNTVDVTSGAATITVNAAPVLSVTVAGPTTATVGTAITLTATAVNGTAPYTYQWYNGGAAISGATAATYSYTATAAGTANITCEVTDSTSATDTSAVHAVVATTGLSASISGGSTVSVGSSVTLTVTAAGGTAPYTYQWLVGGTPVPGAIGSTFAFSPAAAGSYAITCAVTDSVPNTITTGAHTVTTAANKDKVPSNYEITGLNPAFNWSNYLTLYPNGDPLNSLNTDQVTPDKKGEFYIIADMFLWKTKGSTADGAPIATVSGGAVATDCLLRSGHFNNIGLRKSNTKNTNGTVKSAQIKEADSKFELKFVDYFAKTSDVSVEMQFGLTFKGKTDDALTFGFAVDLANMEDYIEEDQEEVSSYGHKYLKAEATVRDVEFEGDEDGVVWATKTVVKGQKYYFNATTDISDADQTLLAEYPEIDSIYTVYQVNMNNATVSFRDLDQEYFVYDQDGKLLGTTKDQALPMVSKQYILTTAKVDFGGTSVVEEPSSEAPAPDPELPAGGGDGSGTGGSSGYNPNTGL